MEQAEYALGCTPSADWVSMALVRLPTHLGGFALPSLAEGRHAAFLGAVTMVVPSFLGTADSNGNVSTEGILDRPSIEAWVGRGSFTFGATGGWQQYYDSGSSVGAAAAAAWAHLAQCVPADYEGDLRVLHLPAADVPVAVPGSKIEADITADCAQLLHAAIGATLRPHPNTDRQKVIFCNAGRENTLFSTVLPGRLSSIPPDEWVECTARCLGRPSPACAFFAGMDVPTARNRAQQRLDVYGDALAASTAMAGHCVKGLQHDPIVNAVYRFAREYAGTTAQAEDADTFGSILRQNPGHLRVPAARDRTRTVTVDLRVALDTPDASSVDTLVELKTVHYCPTRYGGAAALRKQAVEGRAAALPAERRREIAATDAAVFGTPHGQKGPMETRLDTFPEIVGIVTGAFGEWSQTLIDLLKTFAAMGADAWQAKLGAPSRGAARSTLLWKMRGELGTCVARGHARLILERVRSLPAQLARRAGGAAGVRTPRRAPPGPHDADGAWHHRYAMGGSPGALPASSTPRRGWRGGRRAGTC